jgi:hypothetical protein
MESTVDTTATTAITVPPLKTTPDTTPTAVAPDIRAKLDKLHCLYGRDKNLGDILDGINMRLARATACPGWSESGDSQGRRMSEA